MRSYELILREGIRSGQFGGSIESHGDHALGFAGFIDDGADLSGHVIDLGSGAGLPALVLVEAYPSSTWTLVERRSGRAELLTRAVRRLGFQERVSVVCDDATNVAWGPLRGQADWVTARLFGIPAETAEIGGPLLRAGGSLLTSEPRDVAVTDRWPSEGLLRCGLELSQEWDLPSGRFVRLIRSDAQVADLPRRSARRQPLF